MKRIACFSSVLAIVVLAGCTHARRHPSAPVAPAPAIAIVTPDSSLSGKVFSYNATGRFVVLNFPSRVMPAKNQQLFLYRAGLKVAEVRVTGLQNDDNIVADLVSGEVKVGDEVRDR